jgi:DNA-binding beta-propeller fold protein YncE
MGTFALVLVFLLNLDPTLETAVGTGRPGDSGEGGSAASAQLNNPFDVGFDAQGNLYVSDTANHRIKRVDARTRIITTIAGNGFKGFDGDGGPASQASLNEPYGLAIDRDGTVYFADRLNRRVRKVDGRTGIISTVAGTGSSQFSGDGGLAVSAGLVEPNGVALDGHGKLYIADVADHRIRVVDLSTGTITTFSGTGRGKHEGDGGLAREASIFGARAVEVGPDGTVYILERQGNSLRKVDPKLGVITTIAGTGQRGYTGDGGSALQATFDGPKEMALDPEGNILIVDTENHAIRRLDVRSGLMTTLAGCGRRGGVGDGGPPTEAQLDRPHGVAVGPDGSIYIGDTGNHRVRKVTFRRSGQ